MKVKYILPVIFLSPLVLGFSIKGHYWITHKSFQHLPTIMNAFQERYERPVLYSVPPYYMYPDIYEPSHANEKLAKQAQSHFNKLVKYLTEEQWSAAEVEIGYLAHYAGDAASPTQNSPETWGQIDDTYDLIVDLYLKEIELDPDFQEPQLIDNIYQYLLARCHQSASLSDSLVNIYHQSNSHQEIWSKSKSIFEKQVNLAVRDLRNILFSAWDLAGRPASFTSGGGCTAWPKIFSPHFLIKS